MAHQVAASLPPFLSLPALPPACCTNTLLFHLILHLQASQQDLFHILLGIRATPSSSSTEGVPRSSSPTGVSSVTSRGGNSSSQDNLYRFTPPVFSSNASSPSTAFTNTRFKPPPTPTSFWDTPVGRSLDGSSAVGWTKGEGKRDVVSQGTETLNNPADLGAADRDKKDASSLGPAIDGSDLDGAFASVTVTPAGEEAQLEPNQSSPSLPMPLPLATTISSGDDGPVPSGTAEEAVENTNASQNMKHDVDAPGEGVSMEHMTAQGTGTKAVRSLSRKSGGGGGEESDETGRKAPTTTSKSGGALTGTFMANSCGKLRVGNDLHVSM